MSKQCGYCVYLDVSKFKNGQFYCERTKTFTFANSTEAADCYRYCERFRKDMYLGDEAIEASSSFQKRRRR